MPGRRACGWTSIIAGSCYLALSILFFETGLIVIAPTTIILILVGAGYLRPVGAVPRAYAWAVMLLTTAVTVQAIIRYGLPAY